MRYDCVHHSSENCARIWWNDISVIENCYTEMCPHLGFIVIEFPRTRRSTHSDLNKSFHWHHFTGTREKIIFSKEMEQLVGVFSSSLSLFCFTRLAFKAELISNKCMYKFWVIYFDWPIFQNQKRFKLYENRSQIKSARKKERNGKTIDRLTRASSAARSNLIQSNDERRISSSLSFSLSHWYIRAYNFCFKLRHTYEMYRKNAHHIAIAYEAWNEHNSLNQMLQEWTGKDQRQKTFKYEK